MIGLHRRGVVGVVDDVGVCCGWGAWVGVGCVGGGAVDDVLIYTP